MDNLNEIYDDMKEKHPTAWAEFMVFVNKYKAEVAWPFLFSPEDLKFHDLPYDMQVGVIMRFFDTTANRETLANSRAKCERYIRERFAEVEDAVTPSSWKKPVDQYKTEKQVGKLPNRD